MPERFTANAGGQRESRSERAPHLRCVRFPYFPWHACLGDQNFSPRMRKSPGLTHMGIEVETN